MFKQNKGLNIGVVKQDLHNGQNYLVTLSHALPLTTPTTTSMFIMAIKAHVRRHITFHLGFPTMQYAQVPKKST